MPDHVPLSKIEIVPGLTFGDIQSPAAADDALFHLTRDLASISAQIEAAEERFGGGDHPPSDQDLDWLRRCKSAKKLKSQLRAIVTGRRGELSRAQRLRERSSRDQQLLALLKEHHPEAFAAVLAEHSASVDPTRARGDAEAPHLNSAQPPTEGLDVVVSAMAGRANRALPMPTSETDR